MMRRVTVAGLALATTLAFVQAFASVTFILTNGARATGDVASFSEGGPGQPRGELNLNMMNGDERNFDPEMVAVIDYVGGRPDAAELAAVPNRGQLLVMKDGARHLGRFVGLRDGKLRWNGMSGRVEEYSVDAIRRIYLNGEAAKDVFGPAPPEAANPGTPRAGRQADGSIVVAARESWVDTGLTVQRGESLRFEVSGEIQYGRNPNQRASAAGNEELRNRRYPVSTLPVGALIGRIGNGAAFPIGASARSIEVPANGRLMLGINDNDLTDNAGFFRVVVVRER